MRKIEVKFVNTGTTGTTTQAYTYYTTITDLKEGDLIVVPARNTYGVAKFVRYVEGPNTREAHRVATQRVDSVSHLQAEAVLVERQRIKQEMMERKAQLEEEAIFALLAEKDPTMQALLETYNALNK